MNVSCWSLVSVRLAHTGAGPSIGGQIVHVLYCVVHVLYCAVLCCTVLYCAVLCCTVPPELCLCPSLLVEAAAVSPSPVLQCVPHRSHTMPPETALNSYVLYCTCCLCPCLQVEAAAVPLGAVLQCVPHRPHTGLLQNLGDPRRLRNRYTAAYSCALRSDILLRFRALCRWFPGCSCGQLAGFGTSCRRLGKDKPMASWPLWLRRAPIPEL